MYMYDNALNAHGSMGRAGSFCSFQSPVWSAALPSESDGQTITFTSDKYSGYTAGPSNQNSASPVGGAAIGFGARFGSWQLSATTAGGSVAKSRVVLTFIEG